MCWCGCILPGNKASSPSWTKCTHNKNLLCCLLDIFCWTFPWHYFLKLYAFIEPVLFSYFGYQMYQIQFIILKCVEFQTYEKSGWNMRFLKREVQMFLQSVHIWSQKKQFCCSLSFVFSASNSHFGGHIATIGLDGPHFLADYQTILFNCAEQK